METKNSSMDLITCMNRYTSAGFCTYALARIGKVAVWVPVVALPAECLIRSNGRWFGRIQLPHKIPFGTRGHRCQFRLPPFPRVP